MLYGQKVPFTIFPTVHYTCGFTSKSDETKVVPAVFALLSNKALKETYKLFFFFKKPKLKLPDWTPTDMT